MKRLPYLLIIFVLISFISGCTPQKVEAPVELTEEIRVASLKGPTSIGLARLMDQNEKGESNNKYNFTMAATADEIVAAIGKGDLDVAAIPANLASVLYSKTEGKISVVAINTLGVLYIVENGNTLDSIEDLKGKTIYSTGKGTTPEHVLSYILKSNDIEVGKDVTVEYKTETTEVATLLTTNEDIVALLPQPFIAAAQEKNENIEVRFSMDEEWNKLDENSSLVTGVVIVNNEFLKNNKDSLDKFLDEYRESVDYVNNNLEEAAILVGNLDIIPAAVAEKAIPLCNITFIEGSEMEDKLSGYLKVLYDAAPNSIGGNIPDEGFYYKR
ncbi:MqnA/MqnD/SBP family protein [Tissierella sp. Yu-01]|uniref:ABC transporter substrate-binding protein n=1 Tax=Tissierella sp. Yu-01 TaxID=3035694 RepID=UPI00240D9B04|nr:MqnA/MqnD/SBP family protein [Tissierella sp. Yu-01]WFA09096.1 ABC transporter substrate-binding protein [Tissierella sp. Yu-01]